jgi:citrate synthase
MNGLEGVIAAETRLSDVDGERGRLIIAGYDVEALAGRIPFEHAAALLLNEPPAAFAAELGAGRAAAFEALSSLGDALARADAMDALRASVAHLSGRARHADVIGAAATFAGAWACLAAGRAPRRPDPEASHASDLLAMMRGRPGSPKEVAALDSYLVTVIDHGMNASTFAARVVASTGSDLVSAIVAAIGALKGPLHGGAPGPVLDMLDAIGTVERATPWLEEALAAKRRIMGMGHRIYRVRDPRAAVLERAIAGLEPTPRLELARAVERCAEQLLAHRHPDRRLKANVEFYTAVLLEALSIPRTAFTATFAAARSAGWCAHVIEQQATGRLIRPGSRYVGPLSAGSVDIIPMK